MDSRIAIFNMQDGIPMKRRKYPEIWYWDNERKTIIMIQRRKPRPFARTRVGVSRI